MISTNFLLLLLLAHCARASNEPVSTSLKPPDDKTHLEKSQPYQQQESSFLSRIASWIYPFGESNNDLQAAEGHHGGPQYLPPPQQKASTCNPCNQSPWIPLASHSGPKTVLNFVQSSHQEYGPPPIFRPKPEKINYGLPKPSYGPPLQFSSTAVPHIEHLRPPLPPQNYGVPKTLLKPIIQQDYGSSIGMRPPPVHGGIYHSLPSTTPSFQYGVPSQNLPPPPPPPSDSYGEPVSGPNSEFQLRPEFLPIDPLPLPTDSEFDVDRPIPLPNLSSHPVAPFRDAQDFRQGSDNVQVVPSVKIADFVSSIDHPINVIQSPIVDLAVKSTNEYGNDDGLDQNPIVVGDTHTAASAINVTFQNNNLGGEEATVLPLPSSTPSSYRAENHDELLNSQFIQQFLQQQENKTFKPPPIDYTQWQPAYTTVPTGMVPPKAQISTWLRPVQYSSTTKRPKQVQIIIPYVNSNKKRPLPFNGSGWRSGSTPAYTTLLPVYTPPPTAQESLWTKFADDFKLAESQKVTATAFTPAPKSTTQVYNIGDLLKDTQNFNRNTHEKLPYDVISLQNNIDDWTQQAYVKNVKSTTKFVPSKKIPNEYFYTQPYNLETTATSIVSNTFDYEPAGSSNNEDIESNLIFTESTTEAIDLHQAVPSSSEQKKKSLWDVTSVSPVTKEKVYIVTPQPIIGEKTTTPMSAWSLPPTIQNATTTAATLHATPKFLVRVDPESKESRERLQQSFSPLTVVFSEWPHLINNLQTTTKRPTTRHPLFGLMDLSAYTPPPNSTVQTISGHSKVVSVVTPSSVTEKKAKV